MHTSGEYLSAVTPLPVNKGANATQEWGKAMTYSRRYGLLSVLGLCVGIIDNDGDLDADAKPAAKVEHQQTKAIPGIPPEEMKLETPELNALIDEMKKLSDGKREKLATSFSVAFKLGDQKLSRTTISRRKHQTWIQEWLKAHA